MRRLAGCAVVVLGVAAGLALAEQVRARWEGRDPEPIPHGLPPLTEHHVALAALWLQPDVDDGGMQVHAQLDGTEEASA